MQIVLRVLRALAQEPENRHRIAEHPGGSEVLQMPTHTLHTHGRFIEPVDLGVPEIDRELNRSLATIDSELQKETSIDMNSHGVNITVHGEED